MPAYRVLVYGNGRAPDLHIIDASTDARAEAVADCLMVEAPNSLGVEVVCEGRRVYVRGVVPVDRRSSCAGGPGAQG